MSPLRIVCLCVALACSATAPILAEPADPALEWVAPPPGYSFAPLPSCPELARRQSLYRVCDDQMAIFAEALFAAKREGKLLLVTFGATWCPTCKELHQGIEVPGTASRPIGQQFVRVEIAISTIKDGRRITVESGEAVLKLVLGTQTEARARSVPFIAVIDPLDLRKTFARNLDDTEHASGGGVDLDRVRDILNAAEAHIRSGAPAPSEPSWLRRKLRRWFAI